jgi:hypothetical protein
MGVKGGVSLSRTIDILVESPDGEPVLVVECKTAPPTADAERELGGYSRSVRAGGVPFAMLADPNQIRLYRAEDGALQQILSLETADVLTPYEPQYGKLRIYEQYFTALVAAWLRDVMDHWRGPSPPGEQELTNVGLVPRITEGRTRMGVRVGAAALS